MNAKTNLQDTNSHNKPPASELDQIKNILVGREMHGYDKRFEHLEHLEEENKKHQARLEKRVEDFERHLRKRLDDALHELHHERKLREKADRDNIKQLGAKTEEMNATLSSCFTELAQKFKQPEKPTKAA